MSKWPFCNHPSSLGVVGRAPGRTNLVNVQRMYPARSCYLCPLLFIAHKIVNVQLAPQTMSYPFAGGMRLAQPETGRTINVRGFQGDSARVLGTLGEFVNSLTLTLTAPPTSPVTDPSGLGEEGRGLSCAGNDGFMASLASAHQTPDTGHLLPQAVTAKISPDIPNIVLGAKITPG